MITNDRKKCNFTVFFAVFGAVIAVMSVAALIVKFFVLRDVKYGNCYQCSCDDADDDMFEDEDNDFVDDEDKE